MNKITVYRVENSHNKKGMYNCDPRPSLFDCPFYSRMKRETKLHPRPEEDTILRRQVIEQELYNPAWDYWNPKGEKYIYGFANPEQLKMWLHNHQIVKWLSENDFVIVSFEVEKKHVLIGQTQAMFIRPHGEYITHEWSEFYEL